MMDLFKNVSFYIGEKHKTLQKRETLQKRQISIAQQGPRNRHLFHLS